MRHLFVTIAFAISVAATLLLLAVLWITTDSALRSGRTPPTGLAGQVAVGQTAQIVGLVLAVIGGVGLAAIGLGAWPTAAVGPWTLVALTGLLVREPHWGLGLAAAVLAAVLTVASTWPRRPALPPHGDEEAERPRAARPSPP